MRRAQMRPGLLVDRATAWADRVRMPGGFTQADLRRSLPRSERRSSCYVSHVVRLGEALRGLPPAELAFFRTPRLTYRMVAAAVRRSRSSAEIRSALRASLTPAPSAPRTPRRTRRRPASEPPAANTRAAPWDTPRALANPAAAVEEFLGQLSSLHAGAQQSLAIAIERRHGPGMLASQSLGRIVATVRSQRPDPAGGELGRASAGLSPAESRAVAALAELQHGIARALSTVRGERPAAPAGAPGSEH